MAQAYKMHLTRSSTQYAYVLNDMGITNGAITMACWFNLDSSPASSSRYVVFEHTDAGTQVIYRLRYIETAGGSTYVLRWSRRREWINGSDADYTVTLSTGTWYQVVCAYDGTNLRLYLDGSLVAGPTAASGDGTMTASDHFVIGMDDTTGSSTFTEVTAGIFDGAIDDVIVFSVDIGATRASDLKNTPCNPDLTNAVARYECENNFNDSIGGFTLTASASSPTFQTTSLPYTCASSTVRRSLMSLGVGK